MQPRRHQRRPSRAPAREPCHADDGLAFRVQDIEGLGPGEAEWQLARLLAAWDHEDRAARALRLAIEAAPSYAILALDEKRWPELRDVVRRADVKPTVVRGVERALDEPTKERAP